MCVIHVCDFAHAHAWQRNSTVLLLVFRYDIMCCRRLKDSHIWLSVVSRYPHSNFTSVQRLSCCVSQLLTFMLVNIVFYNVDKEDSEAEIDIGFFSITWAEITIGL